MIKLHLLHFVSNEANMLTDKANEDLMQVKSVVAVRWLIWQLWWEVIYLHLSKKQSLVN